MTGAMLKRNLAHHGRLLAVVSVACFLFEMFLAWVAAQIDSGPGLQTLLGLLPAPMRELVGTQFGMVSFAGMLAFGFRHPLITAAVTAVVVVIGTVPAAERESGFLELVLARPVGRTRYLAGVVGLLVVASVLLPLSLLAGVAAGSAVVEAQGELPWTRYFPAAAGLVAVMLAIGGYTLLCSALFRRRGTAAAWAAGLTLVFFWIDLAAVLWAPARSVHWASLFYYFNPITAAVVPHTPARNPAVLLALFAATCLLAAYRFKRQDL